MATIVTITRKLVKKFVLFIDMVAMMVGRQSSDITFKGNPLRMIQAKFGLNWPSGFRGEDF
jgi:hypothetical protein